MTSDRETQIKKLAEILDADQRSQSMIQAATVLYDAGARLNPGFQFCAFEGDPPAPFKSWNEWAASGLHTGVTITASPVAPPVQPEVVVSEEAKIAAFHGYHRSRGSLAIWDSAGSDRLHWTAELAAAFPHLLAANPWVVDAEIRRRVEALGDTVSMPAKMNGGSFHFTATSQSDAKVLCHSIGMLAALIPSREPGR